MADTPSQISIGARVMMQLGSIKFSIMGAAYNELKRKSEYRWAKMDRLGRPVTHQWIGVGEDEIKLKGIIYPSYCPFGKDQPVGFGQINDMRKQAERGVPMDMVTGYGEMLGRYCIKSLESKQEIFFSDGSPRKMEFDVELVKYSEDGVGMDGILFANNSFQVPRTQTNPNSGTV